MRTTLVADEPTAAGGYRPVGVDEHGTTHHHKQPSRLSWFFIGALTFGAAIVLANKIGSQVPSGTWLVAPPLAPNANGTWTAEQGKGRGRQQRWAPAAAPRATFRSAPASRSCWRARSPRRTSERQ